jgi:hygromycin-B 7''-O-kinase
LLVGSERTLVAAKLLFVSSDRRHNPPASSVSIRPVNAPPTTGPILVPASVVRSEAVMPPPLPRIRDWEHFRSIRFDPGLWAPPVRWVLARHELASDGPIELASSVHVVAVAGDVVVKLYQPASDNGMGSFEIETAALRLVGGAGLPVPRLLAAGQMGGTGWPWPYCVMSALPGRPLNEVAGGRAEVAVALGRFLRAMHQIRPAGPGPFAAGGFLAGRLDACVAGHRAAGRLPARWLDEMPGYLDRARPIVLDRAGGSVLTHGDLHAGNVYVHPGPVFAGVLDFNDVRLTDPYYDLVVVHLRALGADRRLLEALLGAYGWGQAAPGWRERMMALTIAHDFDELGDALAARPDLAEALSLDALAERIWG